MTTEAEHKSRVLVKAKAAAAEIVTNPANQELTSIQSQLDSMSKILVKIVRSQVLKTQVILSLLKLNHKSRRDLPFQLQALSQGVSHQFSAIGAWAGVILSTTAQVGDPFKVQLNGETCMGRQLWRVHPCPGKGAPPKPSVTSKAMGGGMTSEGCVPGPQYHNPDPLVRLIGTPMNLQLLWRGYP